MNCPACHAGMTEQTLEGHLGTTVAIDLCGTCQLFWFDSGESLKLSPAGVLALFQTIGETASKAQATNTAGARCPRCREELVLTHDFQRNTKFQYLRCPSSHGRLTTFMNFLREKDFIRPLSPQDIQKLREDIQTVRCSSCGAPIDLSRESACAHCGSPLSMLDMKQASKLIADLRTASERQPAAAAGARAVDPSLLLALAREQQEVERAFASFDRGPDWPGAVAVGGLVGAGLSAIARWLKQQ